MDDLNLMASVTKFTETFNFLESELFSKTFYVPIEKLKNMT